MPGTNPPQYQLLASVIGLAIATRRIIDLADRDDPAQVNEAFDLVHEHLAVIGGVAVTLADDLGIKDQVDARVQSNLDRAATAAAFRGTVGSA